MKKNYILILVAISIGGILITHFMFQFGKNDSMKNMHNNQNAQTSENSVAQTPNTIEIKKYAYTPSKITIKKGTTITWINRDVAPHTVTIDDKNKKGPDSKYFGKGEKYTYTFSEVGVFPYHCEPHPYMKAVVEVTE